jgi:hydroxyacylglutathione hydrolase
MWPGPTCWAARDLCHSLREKVMTLPDHVEVYPTHVAGSLCGGNIASRLSTTIGFERRANQLLAGLQNEEAFVEGCLDMGLLPAVPPYWRRMRRLNQAGPPRLGLPAEPPALTVEEVQRRRRAGAWVLDCRSPEAFAAHIPGALNVSRGASFPTWAGTVLPPSQEFVLVLESAEELWEICWELLRIGYELPSGWLAGGMRAWRRGGAEIDFMPQLSVHDLRRYLDNSRELTVLDVRQPAEWAAGHIPTALHITGAELPARLEEVPRGRPVAVICGSGYRSSVAASLLKHHGHKEVFNVLGGMSGWSAAGYREVVT